MKSYNSHLQSTQSFGEALPVDYRPVMRSSATFPVVVKGQTVDTIITFMGYWFMKRTIKEVTVISTLRAEDGRTLKIDSALLDTVKSYSHSMRAWLDELDAGPDFIGSIELEIFSSRDMVFPYPAITLAYKAPAGQAFVHTCGRIYNDYADMTANSDTRVAEAGFDIVPTPGFSPFLAFVNGQIPLVGEVLELEFFNTRGDTQKTDMPLPDVAPYGTAFVNLFDCGIDPAFFGGERGTVKVQHRLDGFFPRFVVGNIYGDHEALSLTHSYYDTVEDTSASAMWANPAPERFHDSAISFPLLATAAYTEMALYPIYTPSSTELALSFYTAEGAYIGTSRETFSIGDVNDRVVYVDCARLLRDLDTDGKHEGTLTLCKVILKGGGKVPSRLKFGLNIGQQGAIDLPANICFGAKVSNEKLVTKPGTFKWCAILDSQCQFVPMTNSSFLKGGNKVANCHVDVWRGQDGEKLSFTLQIPDNGVVDILADNREAVDGFLGGEIGWMTVRSDNPFVDGYYITMNGSGLVGADHVY